MLKLPIFILAAVCAASLHAGVSELAARGYTVVPLPQRVSLAGGDFRFEGEWQVRRGAQVPQSAIALEVLRDDLKSRSSIQLATAAPRTIELNIAPGSVAPKQPQDRNIAAIAEQAYRLELTPSRIRITANADAGLLYGAETLLQLVKRQGAALLLPEGTIEDWPDLQQRNIYWDDAHHLDHLDVLKNAVRQAAFFKVNGFAIKLEGHFQYASAPALVEPYAMTPAQLQELTDYGLRYHVQVIPYLDGPAHIAFILKHPEYANLRAFPDSNYELCTVNPDSYKLLNGMYADLLAANRGVKYFILSTDEPYYVGMADNAQCNERARKDQLGSVGKVLAEFVNKAAGYLHDHGREVIFWGEYPLKPTDISALPPWLINGETYGPVFDPVYRKHGMRQMIYTSTEGEEKLFPYYFVLPPARRLHTDREAAQRVPQAFAQVSNDPARKVSDLIGMLVAGWGDMGLHPETFWLGYATIAAAGWHPVTPDAREAMASFYPLFYGPAVRNMDRVYQLMSYQAQTWTDTWDRMDSTARTPIWGNSEGIFKPPKPAYDQTVPLPQAPRGDGLAYNGTWASENARRVREAENAVTTNDELIGLLHQNLRLAQQNAYNLEVFLSIAHLCRQNLDFLRTLHAIDHAFSQASEAAAQQPARAVASLDAALKAAAEARARRNRVLADTTAVWYKSWYPRVAEANGRRFLHQLDDVKDHLPDRTVDMSYLVYRELLLPMDDWYARVQTTRNAYARSHNLPERHETLNWKALD